MRYEHTPRPNIESHYHIRELIEAQDKRAMDRAYHKDKAKEKAERADLIKDNKVFTVADFHCQVCRIDFKSQALKQVETDWTNAMQDIAFYKTKCFHGHWCMRLITDRHRDNYWFKSKQVASDRGKHYNDTLQPFETGFNMLYGKK